MNTGWTVHKFGGTSLANADRYRAACEIVLSQRSSERVAVVVSAMSGVTNALIEAVNLASAQDDSYLQKLQALENRHHETIDALQLRDDSTLQDILVSDFSAIREVLRGVWITRLASDRIIEFVSGHGELWSAQMMHAYLESCDHCSSWLDAREVLVVEPNANSVAIDWALSKQKLQAWPRLETDFLIITGYIAATHDGVATTLKRNGSDLSASVFGALLGANSVTIWTDVDGVFSADPRRVPDAVVIPELSYQEAAELAYFGAKVLHPATILPAVKKNIPVLVLNSRNASCEGTRIISLAPHCQTPFKSISVKKKLSIIDVVASRMLMTHGYLRQIFEIFDKHQCPVDMVSTSEVSVSVTVDSNDKLP
ncbi:MAG TPA: aspartate kinase, partial [Pyrinomonadaceae bacterium]|nr:aspartate kinase [Pyrinomonadaceae bacterium]